jgi:hypothetical protein
MGIVSWKAFLCDPLRYPINTADQPTLSYTRLGH